MKKIYIIEDVRFLGVGYSPNEDLIEVEDEVAEGLLKINCAILAEEEKEPEDSKE